MSEDTAKYSSDNFDREIIEFARNVDGEADGSDCPIEMFSKPNYPKQTFRHPEDVGLSKLDAMRDTIDSLESSLKSSRDLDAEQWSRYSRLRSKTTSLSNELREADKRNKNMLNLFRQNVNDYDCGVVDDLPQNLRMEVQRTWHRKYDALLKLNDQLKSELSLKDIVLEEKSKQNEALEQRLLSISESLIQREETVKNICTKYLSLKERKDEQEILLRGSIETLQDALQEANTNVKLVSSKMTLIPSKVALLARETRRSERLAQENFHLREFLRKARRDCRCSMSPRTDDSESLGADNRM